MSQRPFPSIVVPAYNGKIIVDDGSANRTRAIVRDAAQTDTRAFNLLNDNLSRFLDAAAQDDRPPVIIGSREAPAPRSEVGITCHCRQDSRVRVRAGIASVLGVLRIRFKGRPFGRPLLRRASRSPHAALWDPD